MRSILDAGTRIDRRYTSRTQDVPRSRVHFSELPTISRPSAGRHRTTRVLRTGSRPAPFSCTFWMHRREVFPSTSHRILVRISYRVGPCFLWNSFVRFLDTFGFLRTCHFEQKLAFGRRRDAFDVHGSGQSFARGKGGIASRCNEEMDRTSSVGVCMVRGLDLPKRVPRTTRPMPFIPQPILFKKRQWMYPPVSFR